MVIKAVYDKLEDIPDTYRDLFTEKGEKWELTGVEGLKTAGDVTRIQTALEKERASHKAAKAKLAEWGDLTPDGVHAKLDRFDELETAAGGKLDDAKIEEMVGKRVEAKLKTVTAPLERELTKRKTELDAANSTLVTLQTDLQGRVLRDTLRPILNERHVLPEHHEDVFMFAERHLQRTDDGHFITRDGVGVTPGLPPKDWIDEFLPKKPGWLPPSVGGGARGSGAPGLANNPWSDAHWNMTAQGAYLTQHGVEKAKQAATAAGTTIGGPRPKPAH